MGNTIASERTRASLPPAEGVRDRRSRRARMERMAVTPLGGGVYEVESQSGNTYSVDLPGGRCTCPDHNFRGVRCKHLRRVAMEVTERRVPPPGKAAVSCVNCGEEWFADERATGPHLCEDCALAPGETAVDRETGDLLVVVRTTDRRADEVTVPDREVTVADYPTNEGYRADDAVVEAIYPLPARLAPNEVESRHLRRYSFPRSRLVRRGQCRTDARPDQSALDDFESVRQ